MDREHFFADGVPDTVLTVHDGEDAEANHPLRDVRLRDLAEIHGHGGPDEVVGVRVHGAIAPETDRTGVVNVLQVVVKRHRKISF